jgi:signal transduction histidine kinase
MTDGHDFTFPDQTRSELDEALDVLVAKAKDVRATQGRLRALLRANQAVVQQLDLPVVLRRIVESAVELVRAEYGALGVVSPDGRLEQFITVGMPDELIAHIGHLPEGHGLLGALIDDPRTIRLPVLSEDSRSAGFPQGHPSMESFLGVPIKVRDEVFGNLYLTNQASGRFSADDEQLVTALAATAGIAIDNARLFAETRRRQAWSAASAEITSTLLSSEHSDSISTVATRVLALADADVVWMLLPTGHAHEFLIERARGIDSSATEGTVLRADDSSLRSMLDAQHPQLVADSGADAPLLRDGRSLGAMMIVPLVGPASAHGVLLVARVSGSQRFAVADLEMAADFAGQASVAMELAAARADRQRMILLEDRGRIARDLHDHVIQQLFATGLQLHSIAGRAAARDVASDVVRSVANIDASIAQIRTAIFALTVQLDEPRTSTRHKIIDLVNEMSPGFPSTPAVSFSGPVDLVVTEALADDVLAVTREALSNVIKHAAAQYTSLELSVAGGTLVLCITDDGVGFAPGDRRSGLGNLEDRATRRGGEFGLESIGGGTRLTWSVPFDENDDERVAV